MEQYDIFISYKRKSLATANNLYYRLITRGYSTFFDLEEMRSDNFNMQLFEYIGNAKDVFVILEDGSLDACQQGNWKDDWFCKEIAYALEMKRNIIPVLIGNYKMPQRDLLPNELKDLVLKNAPEFSFSYFDAYLDKLIEKEYIKSEVRIKNKITSVFKFYSDKNCQIFIEGKLVCSLDRMSDEPFYCFVERKGEYRLKSISTDNKIQVLNCSIDVNEEKIVHFFNERKFDNKWIYVLSFFCSIIILINLLLVFNSYSNVRKIEVESIKSNYFKIQKNIDVLQREDTDSLIIYGTTQNEFESLIKGEIKLDKEIYN